MPFSCNALRFGSLALALAVMAAPGGPAHASSFFSDVLQQKIIESQKAEAERLFEMALANYGEAMGMSRDTPEGERMILKKRAALFEQINMPAKAEADLSAALAIEPFEPKALADRGYFYIRQRRISEALDDFVKGRRVAPKDPMFSYGAARALVAAGDFTNATKFYNEAIKLAPNDGKLYLSRAEAMVRLKKFDEALPDYNRAMDLGLTDNKDRFFALTGLGYINLMNGDFGVAVRSFSRALDITPDASNVLLWRGYANERLGKRDLALRDFQNALVADPDSSEVKTNLDRLRTQMAQTGKAPAK